MKRVAALAVVVVLAALSVTLVERRSDDRRYRQLLVDGERALTDGEHYAAVEAFSGALALHPESMVAYYRRGEAYAAQGQVLTAARDLRAARRLAPDAPQPLEALGRLFDRRGEAGEAARWYQEAARLLGDADPPLLYALALAHYRAGHPSAALAPLRRAVAADDSLVRAHYLLGVVYRDAGKPNDAIASLQHAIRLAPTLLPARDELAGLYGALGRRTEQIGLLQGLLTDDPRLSRRLQLARAYTAAGRHDEALLELARAEESAPDDPHVLLAIGRIHLSRAETDPTSALPQARAALESALAGRAPRSEGLALYGRALFLDGEAAAAEEMLLEATTATPVSADAYAFLADAAEALDHHGLAERSLRRLDLLEGDTITASERASRDRRIGELALKGGDAIAAVRYLDRAVDAGHTDTATLEWLARARWAAGDRLGARAALTRALAQAPDDPSLAQFALSLEP